MKIMRLQSVSFLILLFGIHSLHAETAHSKQEEPTFFQDMKKKLIPHAIEMFPTVPGTPPEVQNKLHTIKKDGAFLLETTQSIEEKIHEGLREGDSSNVYRNAIVNALVEISIIAAMPHKKLITVSEIGDVASTHFEKNRQPASDYERLMASLAYMGEMTPGLSPEMTKIASEEHVSQLLKLTALPARLIHTVSDYLTKNYLAHTADSVGITDKNSKKVLEWMGDIAVDVHDKMLQAPDRIKEMYDGWSKEVRHGINVVKYAGGKNSEHKSPESTAHFAFTEEEKAYIARQAIGHVAQIERQLDAYNNLNKLVQVQEPQKQMISDELLEYANQVRQFHVFRDTTVDVFDGLAALSSIAGNKHTAVKLQTFGRAATSILTHMHTLTASRSAVESLFKATATSASASAIHPYVGIATAVASLVGLFSDDDEGDALMEVLAQGIAMLSKQIHQLHERFDGLERHLDAHHRSVMYAFFKLYEQQGDLVKSIQTIYRDLIADTTLIKGSLGHLSTMQAMHHQEISAQFSSLRLEALDDLVADITADIERGMTSEKCSSYVQELNKKIMITAQSAPMTGAAIVPANYKRIQEVFDVQNDFPNTMYGHPVFDHINLIKKYTDLHCSSMDMNEKGVHPLIWIRAVQSLITLLETVIERKISFKDHADKIALSKRIQEVITAGKETIKIVERSYNASCMQKLFDDCTASLRKVSHQTELYKKEYIDDALKKEMIDRVQKVVQEDCALLDAMPVLEFVSLKSQLDFINNYFRREVGVVGISIENSDMQNTKIKEIMDSSGCETINNMYCRDGNDNFKIKAPFKLLEERSKQYHEGSRELKKLIIEKGNGRVVQIKQNAHSLIETGLARPLSMILYPHNDEIHHRVLVDNHMAVDSSYCQAELLGIGTVRAEYAIENNRFYRRIYFVTNDTKDLIVESSVAYDMQDVSDETVYNFWYGGRYAKDNDAVFVPAKHQIDFIPIKAAGSLVDESRRSLPVEQSSRWLKTPYPPTNSYAAKALSFAEDAHHINHDVDVLAKVKELIRQKETDLYRMLSQKIVDELVSLSDAMPLSSATQKYDVHSKMLEALLVLGYNEHIMSDPGFKELISNSSGVLKNRNALVRYFEQQKAEPNHFVAQGNSTEYLPVEATLKAYDRAHEATRNKDKQKFVLMSDLLAKLQDLSEKVKDIPVKTAVAKENSCVSPDALKQRDREIAELKEGNAATQQKLEAIQKQLSVIMSLLQHRGQQEKIKV